MANTSNSRFLRLVSKLTGEFLNLGAKKQADVLQTAENLSADLPSLPVLLNELQEKKSTILGQVDQPISGRERQIESLQAIVDKLTVENVLLNTSLAERNNEIRHLKGQAPRLPVSVSEISGFKPRYRVFKRNIHNLSIGLWAFALDGGIVATSVAFPELALLETVSMPVVVTIFSVVGVLGVGSGVLDEIELRRGSKVN